MIDYIIRTRVCPVINRANRTGQRDLMTPEFREYLSLITAATPPPTSRARNHYKVAPPPPYGACVAHPTSVITIPRSHAHDPHTG